MDWQPNRVGGGHGRGGRAGGGGGGPDRREGGKEAGGEPSSRWRSRWVLAGGGACSGRVLPTTASTHDCFSVLLAADLELVGVDYGAAAGQESQQRLTHLACTGRRPCAYRLVSAVCCPNPNRLQHFACTRRAVANHSPAHLLQACTTSPAARAKQPLASAWPPGMPQSGKLHSRSTISSACWSWTRHRLIWQSGSPSGGVGGHSKHDAMIAGKACSKARGALHTTIRQHAEQRSK